MVKITFGVEGMHCGMCESHVNDVVRKTCNVSKVTSSHSKNQTVVIAEDDVDQNTIKSAIESQGYRVSDIHSEPYQKKSPFGKKNKD